MIRKIEMQRKQVNLYLLILVFVSSFPSWIKPSTAVVGLSGVDQISWVLWPLLALFYGGTTKNRDIKKFLICMLGYLTFYIFMYHVVESAGITMNIGNISYLDAMKWSTIWLWICYLASFASLILTIVDFVKKE